MKLVFLGTAQDGGVPQVGCNCMNCRKYRRSAASIALVDGSEVILIDITPDFRAQYSLLIERYDANLSAVYLTHAHWGHYGGLMLLGKEGWNVSGIPLHLSRRFFDFLNANEPFRSLFTGGNLIDHIIEDHWVTKHGIKPIEVPHREEYSDAFGFMFRLNEKNVLYLPCVDSLDAGVCDLIRSVDLAIIDGTFYDDAELFHRDITLIPHPCVVDSLREFDNIPNRIIFTHLNHTNPLLNRDGFQAEELRNRGFIVADDWDVIE